MKKIQKNYKTLYLIVLSLFYCTFSITILWDTGHYMSYVSIFEKILPWNSWDVVRGPVFPLLIYASNFIFGRTSQGLIILTFIFYIMTTIVVYKILNPIISTEKNKIKKVILLFLCLFLFIINPIIFGYYHTLLTEFVAMTLAVLLSYISWKLINEKFEKINKNYLLWLSVYVLAFIISFFLKQPYVTVAIFPLLISIVICLFQNEKLRSKVYKILIFVVSCICLVISLKIWNSFLESKKVNVNTDRNVVSSFGEILIGAVDNFELNQDIYTKEKIESDQLLSNKEKKQLHDNLNSYFVYNISYKSKIIDKILIQKNKEGIISTKTAIIVIGREFFQHPAVLLESYYSNYMAIANIYPKVTTDGVSYKIKNEYNLNYCHENCIIAERITINDSNIFYMTDEMYSRVSQYEQQNNAPKIFRGILRITNSIHNKIYSLIIVMLPIILMLSIILRLKLKDKLNNKKLNLCIILLGFSFLHILVHVATGAVIDRYASPTLIPIFISSIILFSLIKFKKVSGKDESIINNSSI